MSMEAIVALAQIASAVAVFAGAGLAVWLHEHRSRNERN